MRVLIFLLWLIPTLAHSHDKSDIIQLYNGDRVTGEIKGMSAGRLQLSTDYASTIQIEWNQIARIDSHYNFEVRLDSSERLFGNIANSDSNGQLQFTSIDSALTIDLLSVTEIRPIEETLAERIEYSLGANFQLEPELRSNKITANVAYEDRATRTAVAALVQETVTRLADSNKDGGTRTESTSAASLKLEHQRWIDRNKLYRTFTGSYDMNEALGNDGRWSFGAGLGRYFIDRPGMRLNSAAGLQMTIEENALIDQDVDAPNAFGAAQTESDLEKTHRAVEAFANTTWRIYEFGDDDMDVTLSGNLYPSLSDWGRIRANVAAQVDWELIGDVYWSLSASAEYDSDSDAAIADDSAIIDDTPAATFDYTVTMGINWRP